MLYVSPSERLEKVEGMEPYVYKCTVSATTPDTAAVKSVRLAKYLARAGDSVKTLTSSNQTYGT